MKYILASASPRRKELLTQITPDFSILPSGAEEIVPEDLSPEQAPEYLAVLKAEDIAKEHTDSIVIGADTGVFVDGEMLGKPKDRNDARAMISKLSGRTHKVITGCCICYGGKHQSFSEITEVTFFPLSDEEIEEYILSDEPYDKAGAYGIQGKGMLLVEKINGDYFNVVGLPVALLAKQIKNFMSGFHKIK